MENVLGAAVRRIALLAAAMLLSVLLLAPAARADLPVVYNFPTAVGLGTLAPNTDPPGANDWRCRPSAAHPYPVVLVHGTLENKLMNWNALSPLLKNNGYCVYALNYGAYLPGPFLGLSHIPDSAVELGGFVNRVLSSSGAREVDIVGHSQGGMMPRYYIKYLGGAGAVHTLVGLTPSNHGTTLLGLSTIGRYIPGVSGILTAGAPALEDQRIGSFFNTDLDAGGDTIAGVNYTVIASRYDEVVTPYTNSFLRGATNITLSDGCFVNLTEHLGVSYDRRALRYTLNALDPATARTPPCVPTLPGVGG
ncbi:alpha/beta fold hydrolase [Conexibacter sp. JD483]|uniref:esterase/lipase family protein n=1 Tax=unclassified Conexibacter TaxID=2627773 RepID=UPI002726F66D|nr:MULTISPECIES: alpha/beta fold hydrolase [unclassified Conexibacter]MDO8188380.1 alpha/beta fold hydrolase [Conexibacter sp. CPCC 205706]MDO8201126.1 alpha/beta fold hydrolase [Conexibacter sp. CPCC 205762]MDR9371574.1 alpha/beta fold hydrolase [Conexibacter sp. JD483]